MEKLIGHPLAQPNETEEAAANKLLLAAGDPPVPAERIQPTRPLSVPPMEIYAPPVIPGDKPFDGKATPSEKFAPSKAELEQAYKSRDRIRNDWTTQRQSDAEGITQKIDGALQQLKSLAKTGSAAEVNKLVDEVQKDGLFHLLAVQWAQEQMGKGNYLTRKNLQDIATNSAEQKTGSQALDKRMAEFLLDKARTGDRAKDALGYDNFYYFSQGQSTLRTDETRIMTRQHAKNIVAGTDQAERR